MTVARRRKHPRYLCSGGVELRRQEGGQPVWANLSDVSLTGCYVESTSTIPDGTLVSFHLRTHDLNVKGSGVVKTSHHAVGMGVAFLHLDKENQTNLEFLIGTLAGSQELRPEGRRDFVPADPPAQPFPFEELGPPAVEESPMEPYGEATIPAQIMRTITELNELEQHLVKEKVDPRLIAQFHDAMEHTRQTAWTVQQWIDLRTAGGDPFGVLPQLEAERMHLLMKLSKNVVADIDSTSINEFTEGLDDLHKAVQQLHKSLTKICSDSPEDQDRGARRTFGTKR
jgi:hypothetical protein